MFHANHSHLHASRVSAVKPPVHQKPSNVSPKKMQSLDSSVVTKFLQAVNEPKPTQNGFKPQTSHLWKQEKTNNGDAAPVWMNKTLKPVEKPPEAPKPTWSAKALDKPTAVWKPPAPETTPVSNGNRVSIGVTDWRNKYDEAERRRKELVGENQKVVRDKSALERKLSKLEADFKVLESEHREKSQQLMKLSQVSEKVYRDYDNLSSKYEVETSALHRALGAASKWYMENKKLRRESVAHRPDGSSPLDETDGDDHELDELRKTVQDLSKQVGQLKSEVNRAKLQESETQEQSANLAQQLEEERQRVQKQAKEIKELRLMREKFESVTVMVQGEMESLRQQRDKALDDVKRLQGESHEAKKERNVLAHQSSLLMGDFSPDDRMFMILQEVEDLKRKLESVEHQHAMEMQTLQESLEAKSSDSHVELLEEKLILAESELQIALERAEQAEQALKDLKSSETRVTNGPPCAPPPPPPPPMPPMLGGCNPPIKRPPATQGRRPTEGDSLEDMARLLGIQRSPKTAPQQAGAIDNIINEIKGGKFTLKATEKVHVKKEEQPPAVQEMLSIIGTLKRRPRHSRPVDNA